MERDPEPHEEKLEKINSKICRRIGKILNCSDPCIILYNLKILFSKYETIRVLHFNEEMMKNLLNFVRRLVSINPPVNINYKNFLNSVCKIIKTEQIELFLKILSYIDCGVSHYKESFSYTKIYQIYTSSIKNIFVSSVDTNYLNLLIKLLDNEKLAYKTIVNVLKKVNLFIKQKTVERNIVDCCVVINSISKNCSKYIDPGFNMSLISYLVQIFYEPENLIFINYEDARKITACISRCLLNCKESTETSRFAIGIYRECSARIKDHSQSTVYEEACTVAFLTEILSYILELNVKINRKNTGFVEYNILNFEYLKRKSNVFGNDSIDLNKSKTLFKNNHLQKSFQVLVDHFYIHKYRFMDIIYSNFDLEFDRISFYNDLAKVHNIADLFQVIIKIKKYIDWSDMIVLACKKNKEMYLPLLFEEMYINNPAHVAYLNIYLKNLVCNIEESGQALVYFTKYVIDNDMCEMVAHLYLIGLERDDGYSKARRHLILNYINNINDYTAKPDTTLNTSESCATVDYHKNTMTNDSNSIINENDNKFESPSNLDLDSMFNSNTSINNSICQSKNDFYNNTDERSSEHLGSDIDDSGCEKESLKKIQILDNKSMKHESESSNRIENNKFVVDKEKVIYNSKLKDIKTPTKKVTVEVEERKIPGTMFIEKEKNINIREIIPGPKPRNIVFNFKELLSSKMIIDKIQRIVKALIEDDNFKITKNICMLLELLSTKKLEESVLERLLDKISSCLNMKENENCKDEVYISSICICATLLKMYNIEYFNKGRLVNGLSDLLIASLCLNNTIRSNYSEWLKAQCFDILMKQDIDVINLIKEIYNKKKNEYTKNRKRIIKFIESDKYSI